MRGILTIKLTKMINVREDDVQGTRFEGNEGTDPVFAPVFRNLRNDAANTVSVPSFPVLDKLKEFGNGHRTR
jgi:hypothetical protein